MTDKWSSKDVFRCVGFLALASSFPCRAAPVFSRRGAGGKGELYFQALDAKGLITDFVRIGASSFKSTTATSQVPGNFWVGQPAPLLVAESPSSIVYATGSEEFCTLVKSQIEAGFDELCDVAPFYGLEASRFLNEPDWEESFAEAAVRRVGKTSAQVAEWWLRFAPLSGRAKSAAHLELERLKRREKFTDSPIDDPDVFFEKSILVTGAGGYVGSEICRQLLKIGPRKIILLDNSEFALYQIESDLNALTKSSRIDLAAVLGSVTEVQELTALFSEHKVDVVFHCASYKHVPIIESNPLVAIKTNVLGTDALARAAMTAGVERFVLISTDKAVRPTSVKGAAARFAELVVQDKAERSSSTIFSAVRFGNVLETSESVIHLFQQQVAQGGPVTVTHPKDYRYSMTISEAVELILCSTTFSSGGEIFVFDMGEPVSILDLAQKQIEAAGYTVHSDRNPSGDIEIVVTGLRPGEKFHEEFLTDEGLVITSHPKILSTDEYRLSEIEVASAIRQLKEAAAAGNKSAVQPILSQYIPGYSAANEKLSKEAEETGKV